MKFKRENQELEVKKRQKISVRFAVLKTYE